MKSEAALKILSNRSSGIQSSTKGRKPNHRLVKQNRSYTVEEAAGTLGVHKNTVREWLRNGLVTLDDKRPTLILGRDLITFIKARNLSRKRPSKAGQLYCLRCRKANYPAGGMLEFRLLNEKVANAFGICPDCGGMMYRCVRSNEMEAFADTVRLRFEQGMPRLFETSERSLNRNFTKEAAHHAKAQSQQ